LLNTLTIASMAEAAGVHCAIGSNLEWDVGTACMAHACAAIPNICVERYAADLIGAMFHTERAIETPLLRQQAHVRVPHGPGLGVVVTGRARNKAV
jgi:L-alanine-DL-glutamate epimerase-like enolase superfamily enzyme